MVSFTSYGQTKRSACLDAIRPHRGYTPLPTLRLVGSSSLRRLLGTGRPRRGCAFFCETSKWPLRPQSSCTIPRCSRAALAGQDRRDLLCPALRLCLSVSGDGVDVEDIVQETLKAANTLVRGGQGRDAEFAIIDLSAAVLPFIPLASHCTSCEVPATGNFFL